MKCRRLLIGGILGTLFLGAMMNPVHGTPISVANVNFRITGSALNQAGYTNLDGASSNVSNTTSWTNVASTSVDVTITTNTGQIGFRERAGAITGAHASMSNFLRTLVKSQNVQVAGNDLLRLTFADLPLGRYELKTYHHDILGVDSNDPFRVYTDLSNSGVYTLFGGPYTGSIGTNPTTISTVTIPFLSTASTVHFEFRLSSPLKLNPEIVMNGFELLYFPVPEPGTGGLFAAGLLGASLFQLNRRRKRRAVAALAPRAS